MYFFLAFWFMNIVQHNSEQHYFRSTINETKGTPESGGQTTENGIMDFTARFLEAIFKYTRYYSFTIHFLSIPLGL